MFGRKERKNPLKRQLDRELEDLRDDCIALFINSGLTQKQIHERGGPTPTTISKWLYKETHFPRLNTLQSFTAALGYGLQIAPREHVQDIRSTTSVGQRLKLDIGFAGKPKMPRRKKAA
jgi:hypothetical protein